MVGSPSRHWTPSQKAELVVRLLRNETTPAEVCRQHGLDQAELDAWMTAFVEAGSRALDDAPAPLTAMIDMIPALVWRCDRQGALELVNRTWLDYTGLTPAEAYGHGWVQALHPDDVPIVLECWHRMLATGEAGEVEGRFRRHDGVHRWFLFRATPARDAEGNVVSWHGTNIDLEGKRLVEEALRESEQRLRLIVDFLPGLVATMSADGEIEHVNQRVLDYGGATPAELHDWRPWVHPDDLERAAAAWGHSVRTGEPYDIEHRLRGADGSHRWFHIRGLPLRDPDGRILRWHLLFVDVDDRRRAEHALAESERALRLLFESIPGMIAVNGADGALDYVNGRLVEFTGKDRQYLSELGWSRILHPDDAESTVQAWIRSFQSRETLDVTFRMRRADGVYRWMHARSEPRIDAGGRITGWYALLWDIEDQRQADEALAARERELRQLVDGFPGMVAVASPEGVHEYANKRVLDYVGKTLNEVSGLRWLEDVHPDERDAVRAEWIDAIDAGRPMDVTHRWRRADGVYRWFHSRVEPLVDDEGRILRWYGLLVDIDDRKKAEEALRRSESELARVSRIVTMGELTASIAHEVNQPLAAVVNNAGACLELITHPQPPLADLREALTEMVDDANRASAVVARIRQMASKASLERAVLDLRDVVGDVLALVRHESQFRRVTLGVDLPDALPFVLGDRVQLQQVLLNLVVNAMDASTEVAEPQRIVTISAGHGSTEAVVAVRDGGIGVRPEDVPRLFETFYTTKAQGMGMGLAISRSIIDAHRGRLWVERNDGPGTTFRFSLPVAAGDG